MPLALTKAGQCLVLQKCVPVVTTALKTEGLSNADKKLHLGQTTAGVHSKKRNFFLEACDQKGKI